MWIGIGAAAGLVVGFIIAWLISSEKTRSKFAMRLEESQNQASISEGKASAMEATMNEIRTQSDQRSQKASEDFETLRNRLDSEREARVMAETKAKELIARLDEERKLLADAKEKLVDTFKATAGDTLDSSNKAFLKLARESFDRILAEARGDLGKRQEAISGLVRPLSDSLKTFEEHVRGLEKSRQSAYTSIEEQIKTLTLSQKELQEETGNLVTALRAPQVRGQWGEMTLRRTVELSGMSEHCDFSEQVSVESDEGRFRPDMIVHLPGGREIVVDSKVSLDAFLKADPAKSKEERKQHLIEHSRQMRAHLKSLGGKAYWKQFDKAPEFVVMFIPGESLFAAAAHYDHNLIEDALKMKVVPATPTTLIALLRSVAYGWRQEQIAENALVISDLGKQLYDRMRTLAEHLSNIGKGLRQATQSYDKSIRSIDSRVLPAARKFKELGATTEEDIPNLKPIGPPLQSHTAPELMLDFDETAEDQ